MVLLLDELLNLLLELEPLLILPELSSLIKDLAHPDLLPPDLVDLVELPDGVLGDQGVHELGLVVQTPLI